MKFRVQFLSALLLGIFIPAAPAGAATAGIVITNTPAFGATNYLAGYVTNASFTTNAVAVFIFVGGGWYARPGCPPQFNAIHSDGSWSANVALYPTDTNATEFAAFLVPTNLTMPCSDGTNALVIPAAAAATAYTVRVDPSARQLNFAGYGWSVRSSGGNPQGPGPNYFSDSTNNSWVDAQGWLHLKIAQSNGQWQCVEVISDRSFGYGQYRFSVGTPVGPLGTNAVLGMFTWSDDAAYNDREIDIEQSRWEYNYGPTDVEDFAISPYNYGQQTNFALATTLTNSTHSFVWQSTNAAFQSLRGGYVTSPPASNILASWNCAIGIPIAGGEQVHINLWLQYGTPPQSNAPVEMVLTNFTFVPLGSPPAAQWSGGKFTNGAFSTTLNTSPEWHYVIQSSGDLMSWTNMAAAIATNSVLLFTDTNKPATNRQFYRAITEP